MNFSSEPAPNVVEKLQHTPTVLLVDDDADSLFLLEHILRQFVCNIVVATEGKTALDQAKSLQPDLILLDIWLPDINGIEITQALRQDAATRSTPIVAVTALASDKDREKILSAGCTQYISKPYSLEAMESLLRGYLASI